MRISFRYGIIIFLDGGVPKAAPLRQAVHRQRLPKREGESVLSVLSANSPAEPVLAMADATDQSASRSWHKRLAFRRWGDGPVLVLLHGALGSWTHWVRNIEALAARFRVLALDLPGFGESPDVPQGLTPDAYLDWVADAVTQAVAAASPQAAQPKAGIIGFSYGGVVAAAVAARVGPLAHSLTLIGPGGFGEPVGRSIPLRKRPIDKQDKQLLREVTAYNLGQVMLSDTPSVDDPVIDLQLANMERARYDSRLIGWRDTLLHDLHRASCPAQVIWGEHDRLASPSVHARRALCLGARPDLKTSIVPDCGHWVQYACADPVNELLLAFHAPPVSG